MLLGILAAAPALADWKIYYSGKAAKMFGSHGWGNFPTRSACESYRVSRPGLESNNSHCSGFDLSSATPKKPAQSKDVLPATPPAAHQDKAVQQQLLLEQESAKSKFAADKDTLLKSFKEPDATPPAATVDTAHRNFFGTPAAASTNPPWSAEQCAIARQRVQVYRQALMQAADVSKRLSRTIATDQTTRAEWEETMNAAVERAKNRGQFLWLALPLAKLKQLNQVADHQLGKDAGELADLLARSTDPARRDTLRLVRQFNQREREIVADLGKQYGHIGDAYSLGGNASLMLEDPDESPTSIFHGDGMKLRETGEMLHGLIVERDGWKKLAGNKPWARYLVGGLGLAFQTEAAARAMFDSWYDALATGLAWEQIHQANLNADSYLVAVKKLGTEIRKRGDRLKNAEAEFSRECTP